MAAHPGVRSVEEDILDPSSPYSASKAAAEHLVSSFHKTYGLPVLITRSSNNFGPFQYPEETDSGPDYQGALESAVADIRERPEYP